MGTTRELTGVNPATRDLPKYIEESEKEEEEDESVENKPMGTEFSDKTNQLLNYIEKTYLKDLDKMDPKGRNIIEKMKLAENSQMAKAMDYGFDNIFTGGPTPTPSAIALPNGRQGGQNDEMDDDRGDKDMENDDMEDGDMDM